MRLAPDASRNVRVLLGWGAIALACASPSWLGSADAAERRGGIEIGAKGVKATVVELGEKPGDPSAKVVMTQVVNTTISSGVATSKVYAAEAIKDTAEAAGTIARRMREEFQVPDDKIRVFGTSGLPGATNRQDLVEAVKSATGLVTMEFITPEREVELTIKGLLSPEKQEEALLVDIGSGNTKGGLVEKSGTLATFSIPQGSVTFADRVAKAAAGKPFPGAAEELRPSMLEAALGAQVRPDSEFARRPVVYLNGGAAYAMATLMHPEAAKQEEVTLSTGDIAAYLRRLTGAKVVPAPDLAAIADATVKAAAEKEFANVRDNFTRENLIAGAQILTALANVFQFDGKALRFNRTGLTALVRAPIDPGPAMTPAAPAPPIARTAAIETPAAPSPPQTPAPEVTVPASTAAPIPQQTPAETPNSPANGPKTPPVPTKTLPEPVSPGH